ncbi:MAG TPA: 50S ribosomal protein L6 [Candidatus Hydrogenedentes bacterium]|nr:50S ribosomal protein L6 [Candidatus Hydrogenedentota bacterium]HOS03665.1 50S ribosomal protein L6 [Candidatus Hydrogenedentota bacterium]
MSRIGKLPVIVPAGVKVELKGLHLKIVGPKGSLERDLHPDVVVTVTDGEIAVMRPSDRPAHRALHGLTRALIQNMVTGVTQGFVKTLLIQGVGYRVSLQGKSLNLAVGYSHPVMIEPPLGIEFAVEGTQTIRVSGIDRELVGQTAADIRAWREPEPYKGKGIRYENEYVRRKVGKAGSK